MARIPRRIAGIGASDLPNAVAFDAYVGPSREVTADPIRGILALHDGATPGGLRVGAVEAALASLDMVKVVATKLASEIPTITVPATINSIRVGGQTVLGDGKADQFIRVTTPLGPNLLNNPGLNNNRAGWVKAGTVTGTDSAALANSSSILQNNIGSAFGKKLVTGKTYKVSGDVSSISGTVNVSFINAAGGVEATTTISATGTFARDLVATEDTVGLQFSTDAASTATLDNIQLMEVLSAPDAYQDATGAWFQSTTNNIKPYVSATDFGVFGLGNDAGVINAMYEYLGSLPNGGTCRLPAWRYYLNEPLLPKSNVTLIIEDGAYLDTDGHGGDAIYMAGSVETEIPISVAITRGEKVITLTSDPDWQVGDIVHLVSQKNALSRTDAGAWWLGDGTGSLQYSYFAEFNTIAAVLGNGSYRLGKPVEFPDYSPNATGETETLRTAATVKRVTPLKNSHIKGGEWSRVTAGADLLDTLWCHRCSFSDAIVHRGSRNGGTVRWGASWECEANNVETRNDPSLVWDYAQHHGGMNRYKTVGTQDCGFNGVRDSYSAQSIDFTYGDLGNGVALYANVRSYCRGGFFLHCHEGLTSHPGCYQEEFSGNTIIECDTDGIVSRGCESRIFNNHITRPWYSGSADPDMSCAGIALQYGGPRRAVVKNNYIKGFHAGVGIIDSATAEWRYLDAQMDISENNIEECYTGLYTDLDASSFLRNIIYRNNVHGRMGRYMVRLGTYSAGTMIEGNILKGDFIYDGVGSTVALLYAYNNNPALIFKKNTWLRNKGGNSNKTIHKVFVAGITDTTTYPEATFAGQTVIDDNDIRYESDLVADSVSYAAYNQLKYGNINQNKTDNPASSVITNGIAYYLPTKAGRTVLQVDTEASATIDDLDAVMPKSGTTPKTGDILIIRTTINARDVVIRDLSTSSATSYGFQLPGNASITLNDSSDTAVFVLVSTNWSWIAGGDN